MLYPHHGGTRRKLSLHKAYWKTLSARNRFHWLIIFTSAIRPTRLSFYQSPVRLLVPSSMRLRTRILHLIHVGILSNLPPPFYIICGVKNVNLKYNYKELSPCTRVQEPNINLAIKLKNVLDMITKNPGYRGATPKLTSKSKINISAS